MNMRKPPFSNIDGSTQTPWSKDFSALQKQTNAKEMAKVSTEDLLKNTLSQTKHSNKESLIMKSLRARPMLAGAILTLALLIMVPTAYAVVNEIYLYINPDLSEEELEQDLQQQLEADGIVGSEIDVQKNDETTRIMLKMPEGVENLPPGGITIGSSHGNAQQKRLKIEAGDFLSSEEKLALFNTEEFIVQVAKRPEGASDAEYTTLIQDYFADKGFSNVTVTFSESETVISINPNTNE